MANEEQLLFSNRAQIQHLCNNYHSDSFVFEACTWLLQTFRTVDHIQYERFRQFLSFSALAKGQKRSRRYTVTSWNGKHSRLRFKNERNQLYFVRLNHQMRMNLRLSTITETIIIEVPRKKGSPFQIRNYFEYYYRIYLDSANSTRC